ncbi:ABC transporter permease subunit [Corticibacter populi]|uniref:ABC transporter permease subunit n=1 Tax=Corticibacter populi TaxID=1550736 RepID=A0A3M6QPR0_9BURK|nr:ABC transporter permease subunit [Corticibacter populi]RMX04771.1 ABC transporter permease subunit [Corticibacter populi]RZS33819.1 iron(III) transport system permease protein [Corticibacter populi]
MRMIQRLFPAARPDVSGAALDRWLLRACLWLPMAALVLFFGIPMLGIAWRSLVDDSTGSVGLGNYLALMDTPGVWRAVRNSLLLGVSTTLLTVLLAFVVAYGIERTAMPGKRVIGMVMSLPVLAPSLVLGLGLIFLLGRNGVVGKMLGIRPDVYGFWGLLLADVLYALPQAILIIRAALRHGDARQYEAAEMLGAGGWRQFFDITLPGVRYGLLSASFVVFTITITDFGNAVVIGGDFSVLATEIYNQVSGQMKFGMGAVVGILLLLPAALSVWVERLAARRQAVVGSEAALPPVPGRLPARDVPVFLASAALATCVVLVVGTVVLASFIRLWPYNLSLTLRHYDIHTAGGYTSLWTSVWISALAAFIGTVLLFMLTFGVRRMPGRLAGAAALLSSMPVAVPGLVLGLSYVFAFNSATMPWGLLYGSAVLIAFCNYIHYHTQGYATMMTGMRNVPVALEDATTVMGGGVARILGDVYLPAVRTTLVAVALFLFMRSMVTLSAVIFLVSPSLPLAAVTVMRLDEAGFTSQAAAFSTCIMAIVATIAALLHRLTRPRHRR